MLYYVCATEQKIKAALQFLNSHPALPLKGLQGGELEETPSTFCWAGESSIRQTLDGRWCVEKISASSLDYMHISLSDRELFLNVFDAQILELAETDLVPRVEPELPH